MHEVNDIAGLRSLSMKNLLAAQASLLQKNFLGGVRIFGPAVDGCLLPVPPLHAVRAGSASHVALLTGTTKDEARLWSLYDPDFGETSPEALSLWLQGVNGPNVNALLATYRANQPRASSCDVVRTILGDVLFRLPLIRLAEAQSRYRHDTQMYLFAWETPVRDGCLGSPHAVELPFVFGNLDAKGVSELIGDDLERQAERQALSEVVRGAWVAFARTGNPYHAGLPSWPAYEPEHRHTLVFDAPSFVQPDPMGTERSVWGDIPFDGVTPSIEDLPL